MIWKSLTEVTTLHMQKKQLQWNGGSYMVGSLVFSFLGWPYYGSTSIAFQIVALKLLPANQERTSSFHLFGAEPR